jgi:SAM-dependent methyltransferase
MNDGPKSYHIFKQNGDEYFNIFVNFCQLKPTDQILDIGCGIGRKTLPLLDYVDSKLGRYEGIDVFKPHIDWCKKKIEITYPYFHFQHVDIWNKLYNPSGIIKANQYKFPFDKEFDFVILGSVFTHMFISDMRSYMLEINRILKLGGRGMISYFLLNSESEEMIAEGKSTLQIIYEVEPGCKADNPNRFESAMGHDENIILQLFRDLGIKTKIYYGSWCGREQYLTYQDVICLEKI